jgi:SAM-dependent MidA family methyltransferase
MMLPWQQAWHEALYGPAGFYRSPEGPAGHFRTASHAAPRELAAALGRLATELGCTAIVDVGAGRGELLNALDADPGTRAQLRLWGVDVVGRPPGLPAGVGWTSALIGPDGMGGMGGMAAGVLAGALVIGWELLDVVPCPILELDADGVLRTLLVEPGTGREALGGPAALPDREWCERWWPSGETAEGEPAEGDRLEVGAPRDQLWAALVTRAVAAGAGALLAVDYAHDRQSRPSLGSLTGFRAGRAVPPRPDGSMDLTAHVALDAVAAAGLAAGAASTRLSSQHTALRALGVTDSELLDPGGLGGFGWLLQRVGG